MQTQKKTVTELLNLSAGKTTDHIILALMDSQMMDDTPVEKMITAAQSYFHLVANLKGMDVQVVNAL
ncbi:hypothetical protein I5M32_02575 [Pedobacter sp. SD-b]|uniref:Uncharacterized protein n=1 Tax=Pedobacter segetis TaxID=2793069 RepID=A0ABS1BI11_9SPHI|nr:hypothetical protein [Pedobacter segetis]MBK0381834.1 hypothetical protein [Pedobacter segetis]